MKTVKRKITDQTVRNQILTVVKHKLLLIRIGKDPSIDNVIEYQEALSYSLGTSLYYLFIPSNRPMSETEFISDIWDLPFSDLSMNSKYSNYKFFPNELAEQITERIYKSIKKWSD